MKTEFKEHQIVIQLGTATPAVTYTKFAEMVGMSEEWVKEQVAKGNIPIMPKKGKEKPLVNLALYWQIALTQPY
ncbi:regulator [Actinobacillus porcitonsillarum]|uniref:Regulator n=1 Tax=Actinobacillus porcitonsillarum TaxID=189834 RepID=A0A2U8FK46_9PAST|nr:regulator [Actinobacillus porcitonsillarum]AWI51390.1 regulator [Actinobacillus porcitonsillarum]